MIDIFSTSVRSLPAQVVPMIVDIDRAKWEVHNSAEKQTAISTQSKQTADGISPMATCVHWYRSPADDVLTYGKPMQTFSLAHI